MQTLLSLSSTTSIVVFRLCLVMTCPRTNLTDLMLILWAGREVISICNLCDTLCVTMIPRPPFLDSEEIGVPVVRAWMLNLLTSLVVPRLTMPSCNITFEEQGGPMIRLRIRPLAMAKELTSLLRLWLLGIQLSLALRTPCGAKLASLCLLRVTELAILFLNSLARILVSLARLPFRIFVTLRTLLVSILKPRLCRTGWFLRLVVESLPIASIGLLGLVGGPLIARSILWFITTLVSLDRAVLGAVLLIICLCWTIMTWLVVVCILCSPRATNMTSAFPVCKLCTTVSSLLALRGASIVAGLLRTSIFVLCMRVPTTLICRRILMGRLLMSVLGLMRRPHVLEICWILAWVALRLKKTFPARLPLSTMPLVMAKGGTSTKRRRITLTLVVTVLFGLLNRVCLLPIQTLFDAGRSSLQIIPTRASPLVLPLLSSVMTLLGLIAKETLLPVVKPLNPPATPCSLSPIGNFLSGRATRGV